MSLGIFYAMDGAKKRHQSIIVILLILELKPIVLHKLRRPLQKC